MASRAFIGCACRAPATASVAAEGRSPAHRRSVLGRRMTVRIRSSQLPLPFATRNEVGWSGCRNGAGRPGPEIALASRPISKTGRAFFSAAPAATATRPAMRCFASEPPERPGSAGSNPRGSARIRFPQAPACRRHRPLAQAIRLPVANDRSRAAVLYSSAPAGPRSA